MRVERGANSTCRKNSITLRTLQRPAFRERSDGHFGLHKTVISFWFLFLNIIGNFLTNWVSHSSRMIVSDEVGQVYSGPIKIFKVDEISRSWKFGNWLRVVCVETVSFVDADRIAEHMMQRTESRLHALAQKRAWVGKNVINYKLNNTDLCPGTSTRPFFPPSL
jgi:hypothetical protein